MVKKQTDKKPQAVPPALAKAVANAAKQIDGKYCYGLPHYTLDSKLEVELVKLGDLELFEDNEVNRDEVPDWLPFAVLVDEPQFLAISITAPYAVGMWEHETGEITPAWDSLADFASKLIGKKDKTPFEKLEKTLDKVQTQIDAKKYADAVKVLEPIMKTLPPLPKGRRFDDGGMSRVQSLYGLALKGVKRVPEARVAFETAVAFGDNYAMLNLLDMLEDAKQSKDLIAYALKVRAQDSYLDDYCTIWLARYLAAAYAATGEVAKGEAELRKVVDEYGISAPDKLTKARDSLETWIGEGGAAAAKAYLEFFKPKSYDVSPAEAKANSAWWKSLPSGMRDALLDKIGKEPADASDEDIARCMDIDALSLDEEVGSFDKLDVFLKLPRLESLAFYGDPDDLEPLRALPKLTTLTVNNNAIKQFAFPSRADRDLWKAAEAGDRKGLEKALNAGASLASRGDSGKTALAMVASKHDVELCTWLISQGADPWATSHHGSIPLTKFGGEDRAKLEAAAVKAKIPHPDTSPWRRLERAGAPSSASFESELELDLENGEVLAGKWPANATFKMKSPKRENKLYDLMNVAYRGLVASEKLAAVLRGPGIEVHPVTLVDHAGKKRPEPYFFINPLQLECLIVDKCYPEWNLINRDAISEAGAWAINPAKVGGVQLFRLATVVSHPAVLTRELAAKIEGFSGVELGHIRR